MNYRNEDRTKNKYGIPYSPPAGADYGDKIKSRPIDQWHKKRGTKIFTKRLAEDIKHIDLPPHAPNPDFWDGQGLFVHGDTGFGKTVLSANILIDVQKHLWLNFQNKSVLFTSVPKLFNRLKRSYDNQVEETEWDIMDEQNQTWLLVLDDLGVSGTVSDWLLEKLYLLINHRYENLLPTIITSNFNLNELANILEGDRIISRIDRMCTIAKKSHWDK